MNDLLYAFMGLDGKYVRAHLLPPANGGGAAAAANGDPAGPANSSSIAFCIEGSLEPCLQEMAEKVLPIW